MFLTSAVSLAERAGAAGEVLVRRREQVLHQKRVDERARSD